MRLKPIIAAVFVVVLFVFAGCKKKDEPVKNFGLTSITDTTGVALSNFSYGADGKLVKLFTTANSTDLYYSGDKLIRRTYTDGATLKEIDSVYYDAQGRIFKVVNWDAVANTKSKTTVFVFNVDNTINSTTVNYESALKEDELYEFTYSGGKLTERIKSVFTGGSYKLSQKFEFQGYDDKASPFSKIYRPYLTDILNAFVFFVAYPNNITLGKYTTYDTGTGLVTGVTPVTATYTYNTDNLPTRMDITEGGAIGSYLITYQEL